jgi:hypothetical protein
MVLNFSHICKLKIIENHYTKKIEKFAKGGSNYLVKDNSVKNAIKII